MVIGRPKHGGVVSLAQGDELILNSEIRFENQCSLPQRHGEHRDLGRNFKTHYDVTQ
jgi:hypothetical protein